MYLILIGFIGPSADWWLIALTEQGGSGAGSEMVPLWNQFYAPGEQSGTNSAGLEERTADIRGCGGVIVTEDQLNLLLTAILKSRTGVVSSDWSTGQ